MKKMNCQAEKYFEKLWNQEKQKWAIGEVSPIVINEEIPANYCLTTVAKVEEQIQNPIEQIEKVKNILRNVAGNQFFYPLYSTHITLIGCTQRDLYQKNFTNQRIENVKNVCSLFLDNFNLMEMTCQGINISGNKIFIQVFPDSDEWFVLKMNLEKALKDIYEQPIVYPNSVTIHMNIMIVIDNKTEQLLKILDVIDRLKLRDIKIGKLKISTVDLVLTDSFLSKKNTKQIKKYR